MEFLDPLELFWEQMLSRDPQLIQAAFASIDPATRQQVMDHIQAMATQEGWHPDQRQSAQAALDALRHE